MVSGPALHLHPVAKACFPKRAASPPPPYPQPQSPVSSQEATFWFFSLGLCPLRLLCTRAKPLPQPSARPELENALGLWLKGANATLWLLQVLTMLTMFWLWASEPLRASDAPYEKGSQVWTEKMSFLVHSITLLSSCSVAVKRPHDQSNSYERAFN